jgi:hypothetical protein
MRTLARTHIKADIRRRLSTLQPDSARRWGRMSVHQMVCHLSDCFRMLEGRKTVSRTGGVLERTVVKWIALYLPVRWPEGTATRPEVDQEGGGTAPADFAADVAELERLLDAFAAGHGRETWGAHPVFGPLSEAQWFRWAYLHIDHHLRQFGA